jgi:DNA polymerase-3 subunit delta'
MITVPVGHTAHVASLLKSVQRGTLHQGLLFAGPSGIGKRTVAHYIAAALLCEAPEHDHPCQRCEGCLLARVGNHPDLFLFNPSLKETSTVEALRQLLSRLSLRPYRGRAKVVVIDAADAFSIAAANIFLKTLEEPRPQLFFILVTENPSRLPITIRSRAQRWDFAPLSSEELAQVLAQRKALGDDAYTVAPELLPLADGSLTHLHLLHTSGEYMSELQGWVDAVVKGSVTEALALLPAMVKEKAVLPDLVQLMILLVRYQLRTAVLGHAHDTNHLFSRLALLLSDLLVAPYVLFERHMNPLMVFTDITLRASGAEPHRSTTAAEITLSEQISL